jgi:hypothetical protein
MIATGLLSRYVGQFLAFLLTNILHHNGHSRDMCKGDHATDFHRFEEGAVLRAGWVFFLARADSSVFLG